MKKALAYHLAETDQHRVALELICKQLGVDHDGNYNDGMKKILDEAEKMTISDVSDEVLVSCARKVEHYEIASYRSAAHYTEGAGYPAIASRLRLTLEEEQQAENKLKFLATEVLNLGRDPELRNEVTSSITI